MRNTTLAIASLILLASSLSAQEDTTQSGQIVRLSDRVECTAISFDDGDGGFLMSPTAVFFDAVAGEVFVGAARGRIVVFDTNLVVRYFFDHFVNERISGELTVGEPRAVVVARNGDILVADNLAAYIDVLNFRGESVFRIFPNQMLKDSTLDLRADMLALDESGNIYVGVTGDLQTIMVLDSSYEFVRKFGKKGDLPQDFNQPVALGVAGGIVAVADLYAKPAVKLFDTLGTYLVGFAKHDVEKPDLSFASGIASDRDSTGNVRFWISDALRQAIKVYNSAGEFIDIVGGYGTKPGEFLYPSGISGGTKGTFFVVEKVAGRVQKLQLDAK